MTNNKFVEDWTKRYKEGTCTMEQLERLYKINRLSYDELQKILKEGECDGTT